MARETKSSGYTGFPVLDSRTSALHVCSRDVSKDSVGQSWRFLLPLRISLFQTANQTIKRPQSAKRSEKGYGDENGLPHGKTL